jgi:hypothetical protein
VFESTLSYWVSRHLKMIGAHLLGSRPAIDILKHFLQKFYHLAGCKVAACLPSWVLCTVVFPTCVHLLLQRHYSADQPFGGHADLGQAEFLQLIDLVGQGSHQRHFGCSWLLHSGMQPTKGGRLGS